MASQKLSPTEESYASTEERRQNFDELCLPFRAFMMETLSETEPDFASRLANEAFHKHLGNMHESSQVGDAYAADMSAKNAILFGSYKKGALGDRFRAVVGVSDNSPSSAGGSSASTAASASGCSTAASAASAASAGGGGRSMKPSGLSEIKRSLIELARSEIAKPSVVASGGNRDDASPAHLSREELIAKIASLESSRASVGKKRFAEIGEIMMPFKDELRQRDMAEANSKKQNAKLDKLASQPGGTFRLLHLMEKGGGPFSGRR